MPASRAIACLVAGALLTTGCGDDETTTTSTKEASSGAEATLERILAPDPEVDSGLIVVDAAVVVRQDGGEAGQSFRVRLKGPFESPDGEPARFELDGIAQLTNLDEAAAEEPQTFRGSLTSTGDAIYLGYEGERFLAGDYELDPSLAGALFEALAALPDAAAVLADPAEEASAEIDGAEAPKVVAGLDIDAAVDAANAVAADAGDLGLGVDLSSSLPPAAVAGLGGLVESAEVSVLGDPQTNLPRRISVDASLADVSVDRVTIDIDAETSDLNEPQEIDAPADSEPLIALFRKYARLLGALS